MRILRTLIISALLAVGFSLLVRLYRAHKAHRMNRAVEHVVGQEQRVDVQRSPEALRQPASAFEKIMEGVNEGLWFETTLVKNSADIGVRIDPAVDRWVASVDCVPHPCTLTVVDPDGRTVREGGGVQALTLVDGMVMAADHPDEGLWKFRIQQQGKGEVQADFKVRAASELGIDFLQLHDAAHADRTFDYVANDPVTAKEALKAQLGITSSDPIQADFKLVTADGIELPAPVEAQPLAVREPSASAKRVVTYELSFAAPESDFRILARGHDARGRRFQRTHIAIIRVSHS